MTNNVAKEYLKALKKCKTDKQREELLDRIYSDGFEDAQDSDDT